MKELKVKCCNICGSMLTETKKGFKCKVPGCAKNTKSSIKKTIWVINNVTIKTKEPYTYNEARILIKEGFNALSKTKRYVDFETIVNQK